MARKRSPPPLHLSVRYSERDSLRLDYQLWSLDGGLESYPGQELNFTPQALVEKWTERLGNQSLLSEEQRRLVGRELQGTGSRLAADLMPTALRQRLGAMSHTGRALEIISDDPSIPWEMLYLSEARREDERSDFLASAFSLCHWLPSLARPPARLPFSNCALVVPRSQLAHVDTEAEMIRALLQPRTTVEQITARKLPVCEEMDSGRWQGWHFAGYGVRSRSPAEQDLFGLEGNENLSPSDLWALDPRFGASSPFIFMNGCETGVAQLALAGQGGWPGRFLEAGAGAFLGTLWPIGDQAAFFFCKAFYEACLLGAALCEAVSSARKELRKKLPGDPAWLAYCLFATPESQLFARIAKPARKLNLSSTQSRPRGLVLDAVWNPEQVGKAWTSYKEFRRLSGQLASAEVKQFDAEAGRVLMQLLTSSPGQWACPLPHHNRDRVHLFGSAPEMALGVVCVTLQGEPGGFGTAEVEVVRQALSDFATDIIPVDTLLLLLSADLRNPSFSAELTSTVNALVASRRVRRAAVWDRQRLLRAIFRAAVLHLLNALHERNPSLRWGQEQPSPGEPLLEHVPVEVTELEVDQYNTRSIGRPILEDRDPSDCLISETHGAPITLLLGPFGSGKTTHVLRAMPRRDRNLLVFPGASYDASIQSTKVLIDRMLDLDRLLESFPETERPLLHGTFRAAADYLLKEPTLPIGLAIDGLDESAVLGRAKGLQQLFNCLRDVRVPVILSMRSEFWEGRRAEFASALQGSSNSNDPRASREPPRASSQDKIRVQRIRCVELAPWGRSECLQLARQRRNRETGQERASLDQLIELLELGGAERYYGDLPNRALFFSWILDDVVFHGLPPRLTTRAKLFQRWARDKTRRDVEAPSSPGVEGRGHWVPGALSQVSLETMIETAWQAMVQAAAAMTVQVETRLELTPGCDASAALKTEAGYIAEPLSLTLHSLLRFTEPRTGSRPPRLAFSHRAYQEFFLAWHLVNTPEAAAGLEIPLEVREWMEDIRAEKLAP